MTPRCLLVGHTAPILCLSKASVVLDNNFVVSSTENGFVEIINQELFLFASC